MIFFYSLTSQEFASDRTCQNVFDLEYTLREKCFYSDLFWSVFFRIRTEYGEIPNVGKYRPK